MCLQSQSNGGLKPKLMERYRQEIVQVCHSFKSELKFYCLLFSQRYGAHHLISLHHLEKTGLLKVQDSKGFPYVKKALNLNVAVDELVSKSLILP